MKSYLNSGSTSNEICFMLFAPKKTEQKRIQETRKKYRITQSTSKADFKEHARMLFSSVVVVILESPSLF